MWSAPHADDQPHTIADGLAAASSSRGSCDNYHVSFAPAIASVARDRCHERHGDPNDHVAEMGQFGIAILSQLPIVETRIHRYKRYKRKTLRNAQACLILLPPSSSSSSQGAKKQQSAPKRAIWVVNTHLGCHSGGEQHEQAMELVVFLRSLSQPSSSNTARRSTTPNIDIVPFSQIVLCGDFNSPPFFISMEVIRRAGFVDTWEVGDGLGTNQRGGTFPSDGRVPGLPFICSLLCCCKNPLLRLDYIWFQDESESCARKGYKSNGEGCDYDGIVMKRACVVKNDVARCASDHLPIACYFDV